MVVTDLRILFPLVKMDYGCTLKFLWDSLLPPHTVNNSVSFFLPLVVPQPYRPRQELHLHMELSQLTVDELLNSSNRTLHSICGSMSIASSLMLDGRFSKLLKCSAYLSKVASICEKSASICTEQCGGSRALWVINGFQCIMKFLHVLTVRKRLNFFCFLPLPGILQVPKFGLDCLTNVAVGCFLGY